MKNKGIKIFAIIFTVILIIGIGLFSYLFFNGLSGLHIRKDAQKGQIKVACVGDSITYGHGVAPWHSNNYPAVLQTLLGENYNVQNFGVSGTTAQKTGDQPYIETDVYKQSIEYNADILIFMLGSNDSKPENWKGDEAFKEQYISLLDTYITEDNSPKIYLGIPAKAFYEDENQTSGLTSYDIQGDIVERIGGIVKEIAAERGYKYIDIYELTKEHPELFVSDLVHPNADGAKAIANEVCAHIKDANFEIGNSDVENQIKLIVNNLDKWFVKYTDVYSGYCVTDLNQNGLLEIVACYNQGSGLYSENALFEVNKNIDGLVEYKIDDKLDSQPDLLFSDSVNCYNMENKYCYVFCDSLRVSGAEHLTFLFNSHLDNNQFNSDLIAHKEILWSDNENFTETYKNSNNEKINEVEFNNAEKEYFNGYKCKIVNLGWYKGSPSDNALLLNKTNDELITILMQSYNTFIGN